MLVIDADSHLTEPLDWLDQTDPALAAELKDRAPTSLGERLMGEIFGAIPADQRPPLEELFPPAQLAVFNVLNGIDNSEERQRVLREAGLEAIFNPPGGWKADERVAFLDQHGIDVQLCLPTFGIPMISAGFRADKALGLRVSGAYNDWVCANFAGCTDRLIPVIYAPIEDPSAAERELQRGRARGARAWIMPLNPVEGRTLGDRAYDRLWAASLDLGLTPIVHQGLGWAHYDAQWGRMNGAPNSRLIFSYTGILIPIVAQMALSAMIYGGVFDRFPALKVAVEEMGVGWVDEWIERVGPTTRLGAPNFAAFFPWEHKKKPDEILRENLRFTPLRGQRADEMIEKFGPDVIMYASDYPHPEGIQVDWKFYDKLFEGKIGAEAQTKFFGGNMAEILGLDPRDHAGRKAA